MDHFQFPAHRAALMSRPLRAAIVALAVGLFVWAGAANVGSAAYASTAGMKDQDSSPQVTRRTARAIARLRQALWSGDFDAAMGRADATLDRDLSSVDRAMVLIERSTIKARMGAYSDAIEDLTAALALNVLPPRFQAMQRLDLAMLHAADGDYIAAVQTFHDAFDDGARSPPGDAGVIGSVYMLAAQSPAAVEVREPMLETALAFVDHALKDDALRSQTMHQLSLAILSRLGRYGDARARLAQWAAEFPGSERVVQAGAGLDDLPDACFNAALERAGPQTGDCVWRAEAPPLSDLLPLLQGNLERIAPQYPVRAAERGIEGFCAVRFDVAPDGTPANITPTRCDEIFAEATVSAVANWRYEPRIENGVAVWRRDIVTELTFELD